MFETWFQQPDFLLTLLVLPLALGFMLYAALQRRHGIAQLGMGPAQQLRLLWTGRRRWKTSCLLGGLVLLGLACAQPQWGRAPHPQQRSGGDFILVLDLSRSMLAEQPSRRELAIRSLRQLADQFEQEGGNRVALVIFASRGRLLFPLTHDYDHLRHALNQIEADDVPSLESEPLISGTRIGSALKLAVEVAGTTEMNRPMIVLLSDGDDPVSEDEEWLEGVMQARSKQIPIHAVGFGDPHQSHVITIGQQRLEFQGELVRTRLNEERMQEIARRTRGLYLAARTQSIPLGMYLQHLFDARALRPDEAIELTLPVYQQRYEWFLLPALLVLMLSVVLGEGPGVHQQGFWKILLNRGTFQGTPAHSRTHAPARAPLVAPRLLARLLFLTPLILISGAPAPVEVKQVQQGNEAFSQQDYDSAIRAFEQVETRTKDPGLIAFNKAAAYYRQKRYREAIECYRRCLDDAQASTERLARASFDLGNALLHTAGEDPIILSQAAAAYRDCLRQSPLSPSLRADARYNLELTQLLWVSARPQPKSSPQEEEKKPSDQTKDHGEESLQQPTEKEANRTGQEDSSNRSNKGYAAQLADAKKTSRLTNGFIQTIPEQDVVLPLQAELVMAALQEQAERIARERHKQRHGANAAPLSTKDW